MLCYDHSANYTAAQSSGPPAYGNGAPTMPAAQNYMHHSNGNYEQHTYTANAIPTSYPYANRNQVFEVFVLCGLIF